MKFKIFKYELIPDPNTGIAEVEMECDAKILSIHEQRGNVCLWAMVYHNGLKTKRRFLIAVTGHETYDNKNITNFIGTVHMLGGNIVFHIFEMVRENQ